MSLVRPEEWQPQGVDELERGAWDALREVERSVLVTAGAGAGKTEFLAQKAAYLLQTGLCPAPKRILSISFKRDAARNLGERVLQRCLPEQARRFDSLTFDAFTKNLLDRFRLAIPQPWTPPSGYRIVFPKRGDFELFFERHGLRGLRADDLNNAIARTALPLGENALGNARAVAQYWQDAYGNEEDLPLSFPMINRLVHWLLRENPRIVRALRMTYPFVFLDEFQDTTTAQFEVLGTIFDGSAAKLTAVGDDKQRIMVWAGAMRDAFQRFERTYGARRESLVLNWRSHGDLVRIQHVIAARLDPAVDEAQARGAREIEGDVAAIWEFPDAQIERETLAAWISQEIAAGVIEPHDAAILVLRYANDVEEALRASFAAEGLRVRNLAREVGGISLQDLLGEELTDVLIPLLRLGASKRSPDHWSRAQLNIQFLHGSDPADEAGLAKLQQCLQTLTQEVRRQMRAAPPNEDSVRTIVQFTLDYLGVPLIRQAFPSYRRAQDFARVRDGFLALMIECVAQADDWTTLLDEFEGKGQVPLMTIHKSKGLEFHTMIFLGLDNRNWWALTPDRRDELNTFFVAFTRAKQRAFFTLCREQGAPINWIEQLLAPVGLSRIDGRKLLAE